MKNEEQQIESEPHYSLFKGPTPVFFLWAPDCADICFKSAPLQLNPPGYPRATHDYIYRIWNNCVLNLLMELKMLLFISTFDTHFKKNSIFFLSPCGLFSFTKIDNLIESLVGRQANVARILRGVSVGLRWMQSAWQRVFCVRERGGLDSPKSWTPGSATSHILITMTATGRVTWRGSFPATSSRIQGGLWTSFLFFLSFLKLHRRPWECRRRSFTWT